MNTKSQTVRFVRDPAALDPRVAHADAVSLEATRLLYGGSVKPDTIAALVAQEHIDGALVGGASLDPAASAELLRNGRKGARV